MPGIPGADSHMPPNCGQIKPEAECGAYTNLDLVEPVAVQHPHVIATLAMPVLACVQEAKAVECNGLHHVALCPHNRLIVG